MFEIILLIVIFILGCLFPAFLIDAIRAEDADMADSKRTSACVTFAFIISIILYSVFSA